MTNTTTTKKTITVKANWPFAKTVTWCSVHSSKSNVFKYAAVNIPFLNTAALSLKYHKQENPYCLCLSFEVSFAAYVTHLHLTAVCRTWSDRTQTWLGLRSPQRVVFGGSSHVTCNIRRQSHVRKLQKCCLHCAYCSKTKSVEKNESKVDSCITVMFVLGTRRWRLQNITWPILHILVALVSQTLPFGFSMQTLISYKGNN